MLNWVPCTSTTMDNIVCQWDEEGQNWSGEAFWRFPIDGVVTMFVQSRIYCMWSIDLFSHKILRLQISSSCGQYHNLIFIGITTTSNTENGVAGL